jgi:hypothetical protein
MHLLALQPNGDAVCGMAWPAWRNIEHENMACSVSCSI